MKNLQFLPEVLLLWSHMDGWFRRNIKIIVLTKSLQKKKKKS